jgi:hypothetical protein
MVDRYTKVVLTVIAACLVWLCAMTTGRPAQAEQLTQLSALPGGVQPVVVVGWGTMDQEGKVALQFVNDNGIRRTDTNLPVRADAPLPVSLPYSAENPIPARMFQPPENSLSVQVTGIRRSSDHPWDSIRTQVDPAPVRRTPGNEQP